MTPKFALSHVATWAAILGSVAVPLLVAYFGWKIQTSVGRAGIREQYLSLAVSILRSDDKNSELRDWAEKVFASYSPVRLPEKLQNSIKSYGLKIYAPIPSTVLNGPLMQEPMPWVTWKGIKTNGDLLRAYNVAEYRFRVNESRLKALQEILRIYASPRGTS